MTHYTTSSALEMMAGLREEVRRRQEPVVLATVVKDIGSNPQTIGARMLVFVDGSTRGTVGGGRIEAHILRDAQALLEKGGPSTMLEYNLQEIGMTCGGVMAVFFEYIGAAPHAVIFGGGHIAAPTAALAANVGFRVTVIDERTAWANPTRFPSAEIINQPFEDFLATFTPQPHHFLILVSQGHAHDQKILKQLLGGPQRYTGMIGSKQKAHKMWKHFQAQGVSEELWQRVQCPMGIPLGEHHPNEIAVSIVAQLIKTRYQDPENAP